MSGTKIPHNLFLLRIVNKDNLEIVATVMCTNSHGILVKMFHLSWDIGEEDSKGLQGREKFNQTKATFFTWNLSGLNTQGAV
jgi:hypothetical protein